MGYSGAWLVLVLTATAPAYSKPLSASGAATDMTFTNTSNAVSGKVGLGWIYGQDPTLQQYVTDAVSWLYTWSPDKPDPTQQLNVAFMPQLWGTNQITDFEQVVTAGYASYVLGFDEPNESEQSNLSPTTAAALWREYIEPTRAIGYQTCSPATSQNPNGLTWMSNFVNACGGGCTLDFICLHWYGLGSSTFMTYVEEWHNTYNKDVFITEFGLENFNGGSAPTEDDQWAFFQDVMPWIVETPWIAGAFPYGFLRGDIFMNSDGTPTDLGAYIISGNY